MEREDYRVNPDFTSDIKHKRNLKHNDQSYAHVNVRFSLDANSYASSCTYASVASGRQ